MTIQWKPLQPGDTVRIIAPSAKTKEPWEDLQKCCEYLRAQQLVPVYSNRIFAELSDAYYEYANTDEERYLDFVDALQSDANAIWCFRGGYGCDRVIERLIKHSITPKQGIKLFLGFSDITNLHTYLTQQWDWATLHASALKQFPLQQISEQDEKNTLDILFGRTKEITVNIIPLNNAAVDATLIEGEIIGGNLTTIQSALGTAWEIKTTGKILLLEDVGESAYRIARIFFQMLNNGFFNNVTAILLGDFIPDFQIDEVISEFVSICPIPVIRISGVGHSPENYPLPLHTKTRIELTENSRLITETGCSETITY